MVSFRSRHCELHNGLNYTSDIVSYTMVSFYFLDIVSCAMVSLRSQTLSGMCTEANWRGVANGPSAAAEILLACKECDGTKGTVNSYVHVVTGYQGHKESMDNTPTMVLDETSKEGFSNFEIKYMGGFWVMIVFQDDETKNRFQSNVAAGSWFSQIIQAHNEFNLEERVMWVEIEGVPCKWWSKNTFKKLPSKWGYNVKRGGVGRGWFNSIRLSNGTRNENSLVESFKIVYRGKVCWVRAIEVPGWVPDFEEDSDVESNDGSHEDEVQGVTSGDRNNLEGDSDVDEVRSEGIRKIPSSGFTSKNDAGATPLDVPDDASDENITSNGKEDGGSVEKQTRVRNAVCTDANESMCSGHFKKSVAPRTGGSIIQLIDDLVTVGQTMGYDMTGCIKNLEEIIKSQGDERSVGKSGGILYVWDPNMFQKLNETVSDYFTIVRGTWMPSGKRLLVISVYAPQELRDKKMLWDYLLSVICNWDGEVVTMGDFNEVRDCSERFGSVFNKKGAEVFNNFIATAGLVELKFMKKLRFLKEKIRKWNCLYKESKNCGMRNLKVELNSLDSAIDKGDGTDSLTNRRMEVVQLIQEMEKVETLEVAQKAKIKWAIEGDENSKYYHGVLNKKRGRLTIRDVLADGIWIESPHLVKKEFFLHFKNRFEQFSHQGIQLEMDFVNRITSDQNDVLEGEVSNEEVKKALSGSFYMDVSLKVVIHHLLPDPQDEILANRLVTVLGDLVNEIQSAFVADRQILDGPFILNEIVSRALHGEGGKIGKKITYTYPSIWLTIVQEVDALKLQGIDLISFITPTLGNGLNTSFWDVPWRGDICFQRDCPINLMPRTMKRDSRSRRT
ncbi:RNA-directed DNA polymerase, eukaryota [Tanacetum coccineum]|uniref:RNA-directed DNA polymerase, eukaryota n=1 Tax=Tanacetum coccineum TaxID=301880 RepID=A0ABQ5GSZ8_9ASTR